MPYYILPFNCAIIVFLGKKSFFVSLIKYLSLTLIFNQGNFIDLVSEYI